MTMTATTGLADLLAARRAEVEAPSEPEIQDTHTTTVTEHGEIVPAPPVAIAEYEPQYPTIPPKVVGGLPYVRDYMKLARTIHSTEMVPVAFQGRPDAILACFLRGYELGFGPMQALDSFNVIQGKVGLTAESMRALIMDNGHQIILSDIVGGDGTVVAIAAKCRRKDWPTDMWETYTYSLEDALTAGLLGKQTWRQNPRAMLDARATSGAGRRYFADVLAGMSYTPEEISDFSANQEDQPSTSTPAQPPAAPPAAPVDTSPSTDQGSSPPATADASETSPAPTTASEPTAPPASKAKGSTKKAAPKADGQESPLLEMRRGLLTLTSGLPADQKAVCRAFLSNHGYGNVDTLDAEKLQEAINIAATWPAAAERLAEQGVADTPPCTEDAEPIDAEVVTEPELF